MSIYELINTPKKRSELDYLGDEEKLALIYKLTETKGIIELLEFIDQAKEDSNYCQSYR